MSTQRIDWDIIEEEAQKMDLGIGRNWVNWHYSVRDSGLE
jgi:hypothetical protein